MRVQLCLAMGILALAGCKKATSVSKPGFDFSAARKVAVVQVTGARGSEAARNQVADLFALEFLQHGFDVVDRLQVEALAKEHDFQTSGKTSSVDPIQAGKILNVQAVVVVNMPEYGDEISMTAKMLDATDGSLLWSSEGSGKVSKYASTVAGALVGAVAGGFAGSRVGGDSGTGTKVGSGVGAVGGGLVGNALAETEAQALKTIISKMAKGMPDLAKKP